MTISSSDDLIGSAKQIVPIFKSTSVTTVLGQWTSLFDIAGAPGAGNLSISNTANGVVPTDATSGCPLITNFAGGAIGYLMAASYSNTVIATALLYDRLFHCGSYAYNSGTTNLSSQPSYSARVPGADYTGLEIWVEVNQAWAASTASSVTVTYTDQDGNAGATTGAYVLPTAVITRRVFKLPLASGDKGVQKIESVALANTTGSPTAGTVNVIVARPLWTASMRSASSCINVGLDELGMPVVYQDSALCGFVRPDSTASGLSSFLVVIASK